MRRIVLTFGLIAGAILSVMMLIQMSFIDRIGFERGMIVGYTTMVLAFLLIFFGIRSYRDNVAGGSVGFGRATAVGLLIMLIASACYVATWELVYFRLMPDFADKYAAHAIEKARTGGATASEIAALTRDMDAFRQDYRNPLINIAYTFLEPLPVGLVMTLVSAGILRRRRRRERDGAVLQGARAAG
jgi:hypothetical protein